jgi:putative endonuclease
MAQLSERRAALGQRGEQAAALYLAGRGYAILERNYRTRHGEIDLVARCSEGAEDGGDLLVFVEVKTRSSTAYGLPEEALTPAKQAHFLAAVDGYVQAHPGCASTWRIDVIAILKNPSGGKPEIIHFENAFS